MFMFKPDVVKAMAEKSGLSVTESERALNAFMDVVKESLAEGNEVKLIGFGKFWRSSRAAHVIKDVNGDETKVPEKKTVVFSAGEDLKKAVNPPKKRRGRPPKKAVH